MKTNGDQTRPKPKSGCQFLVGKIRIEICSPSSFSSYLPPAFDAFYSRLQSCPINPPGTPVCPFAVAPLVAHTSLELLLCLDHPLFQEPQHQVIHQCHQASYATQNINKR